MRDTHSSGAAEPWRRAVSQQQHSRTRDRLAPVCTTSLLALPTRELEEACWRDVETIKAYTAWDRFAVANQLTTVGLMAWTLWPSLKQSSLLPYTWHLHVVIAALVLASALTVGLMAWAPALYARHRHGLAIANRLLRLATTILAAACASPELFTILGNNLKPGLRRLSGSRGDEGVASQLAATLVLMRPLLMPLMAMTQGFWAFRFSWWMPVQLINLALSYHHVQAASVCSMASELQSAPLLVPMCRGMTHLHQLLLGSLLGLAFSSHSLPGSLDESPACADPIIAARTVSVYVWTTYALLILGGGFVVLEWRVKAAFVRRTLKRPLAYGPWAWLSRFIDGSPAGLSSSSSSSSSSSGGGAGCPEDDDEDEEGEEGSNHSGGSSVSGSHVTAVQRAGMWLLAVPTTLGLLWFACLALTPLTPHAPCRMCETAGTCDLIEHCENDAWCQGVGLWAAILINVQLLCTFYVHMRALAD